jgi:deoxyhypusine synthase
MDKIKDIETGKIPTVRDLVNQFSKAGGFSAKMFADGVEIYRKMLADKDCVKFFSFPACIVSTGTRGLIKDMVKNKMVDVIITTCGTMDHDLARVWKDYYEGTFDADDAELHKKGINRLGNVFIPNDSYGVILEKKCVEILEKLYSKKKEWNTRDLVWAFGEAIQHEKNAQDSIIYWAWKNKIPVFIPGPTDGSWGSQLWMFWQTHKDFKLNLFEDEHALSDIVYSAKKSGALMLGGGISKHHVIWWNQFRDGLDYAVQITSAPEWDGSLSGAKVREAVSWGKVREDAKYVSIPGDATILLPILYAAVV